MQKNAEERDDEGIAGEDSGDNSGEEKNQTADKDNRDAGIDEESEIDAIREDAAAARQEAAESHDRLLRLTAEFDNYKKRTQRRMDDQKKLSNAELIKDLLPVIDNLERAAAVCDENREGLESGMVEGVKMTLNELLEVLRKYHVTPIEARGQPFDPNYHEAVMQEESAEFPENTVISELQKGYLLHDRLIRPAMVVVSKGRSTNQ